MAPQQWNAVFERGPRAVLDGASALQAADLSGYVHDGIRVSVPRGARGVPRVRPQVAAVRAGLWAQSDRQAALALVAAGD
ncbi:MAG: hypothetical protein H0V59_05835 [Nocardioidaceae bacterium]|nr:hypothetical protein [Nocardioidaceae bacterium]